MAIAVRCGDPVFDALPEAVREWLEAADLTVALGDETLRGFRSGRSARLDLRDHAAALDAAIYFQSDVKSALDVFLRAPLPDNSFYSALAPLGPADQNLPADAASTRGSFQVFNDLTRNLTLWRDPLQNDLESRVVLAAHRVFQATGDVVWLRERLPILQRALDSVWRHPRRWSDGLELPQRDFTLDSWPIPYASETPLWCVHPGDAARLHAACRALEKLIAACNEKPLAPWDERATHLEAQLNSIGWNGTFYAHQIHLSPLRLRGVDESRQLAACNVAAMLSGVASHEQCVSILREYSRRRELQIEKSLNEWWSVQPPFPEAAFGIAPGDGPNGACFPQVGGALALAALHHGFESYGIDTLRRFHDLAVKPRRCFAWYGLDGTPARRDATLSEREYSRDYVAWREASPHDVSGAAAMLRALIEGVCGVRDDDASLKKIELAPRWAATGQTSAEVEVSYAAQPASYVSYRWALDGGRLTLDWDCQAKHVALRVLLPRGNTPERVALNGRTHAYELQSVEKSKYVALHCEKKRGTLAITLK